MFRIIVFLVSLIWASLLLVSWGTTAEMPNQPTSPQARVQVVSPLPR